MDEAAAPIHDARRRARAERDFSLWHERGTRCLETFSFLMERGHRRQAAFDLFQATEAFYGALLLVFVGDKPWRVVPKLSLAGSHDTLARARDRSGAPTTQVFPVEDVLRAHWGAISAADFFTVEIWTRTGAHPLPRVLRDGSGHQTG